MMGDLRIAYIQCALVWEDKKANLAAFSERIKRVPACDVLVLPEMFTTGFSIQPEKLCDPENGSALQCMKQWAKELNAAITGSIIVQEHNTFYNRMYWVNPDGTYVCYNKRHLFRMAGEDRHYAAGKERRIISYKGWNICPLICYDLRFPVWSRNTFDENNKAAYDVLLFVANWPEVRASAWKILLQARAIENLSYVCGVNRIGPDGNGIAHSGNSSIIDAKGDYLYASAAHAEDIGFSILSREWLDTYRMKFPAGKDADGFKIVR